MTSVRQALDLAWQSFQRGQWQHAERLYLEILQVDPDQLDALHLLAAIAAQTGRDDRAIDYLQAVLRLKPDLAAAHNNLGNVFINQRKLPEAVASFQEAVRLQPNSALAHNNLGNALRETGRLAESVASLQQALHIKPDYPEACYNLGLALYAQGKLADALASLREAVRQRPNYPEAHYHLGVALLEQGRPAEAADFLEQAIRQKGEYAEAHFSLGLAFKEQGKLADAVASFQTTATLKPDLAEAHLHLGSALVQQRNLPGALRSYQEAVRLGVDSAEAHNNLGNLLRELGHFAEAEASLRRGIRLKPDFVEAHYNLGIVLWRLTRLEEAVASYQEALRLKPDHADAYLNIGNVRKDQGRIDDAIAAYRIALSLKPEAAHIHSNVVLALNYQPGCDVRAIQEECSRWNEQHAGPLKHLIRPHRNPPEPERRLRIGYVSADFRQHPCSSFTIPLLANHDRSCCEIVCYSDVARPDMFTERLRGCSDVWREIVGLTDQQTADLVSSDQIDVLVDLAMHTAHNRLLVFARKPAPIQVAWLAYPGTTGLSTIDYRLTDPYLDPPGLFDAFYSEESVRMPETFWCYDPLTDQPSASVLPATVNGLITFGCLNNFCKVNDECLALWARVLETVPRSRLLLHASRDPLRERALAQLQRGGVDTSRVEFVEKRPRQDYLKLYDWIDLALDPTPCNGGTTTLDAFWMGVPTLTLVGKTAVGPAALRLVCNLGIPELAAHTPEQYVALAARMAGDLPRLHELRTTLRQRMLRSPLMDGRRFAHNVERAYRQMWRRWCGQAKPAAARSPVSPDRLQTGLPKETPQGSIKQTLDVAWQHYQKGQWQRAEQLYLQVLEVDPEQVDALHLLAAIAGQTDWHDRAIELLQAVLRLQPALASAHNNLGNAFAAQDRFPEAVASFREAVRLQPDFAIAHNNLGNALRAAGNLGEAVASLQEAIRIDNDYAEAHQNLGLAWQALGKLVDAQASFQQAVRLKPDDPGAFIQLAVALGDQGKHADAATALRQALRLKPDDADSHFLLGASLGNQGKLTESATSYQEAIRLKPDHADAHHSLGLVRKDQGRIAEATAAIRLAVQLRPEEPRFHSNLCLILNLDPRADADAIAAESRRWNERHARKLQERIQPHANDPDPERRLRIGYVSPDFRQHPSSSFTIPLFANHDRRFCEVFCYSDVSRPDALTERLRGYVDTWRDTAALTDQQAADLVRTDQIDVLVDLAMHTTRNRLLMFVRKPAPVQVTWLAYPGTTGLGAIDYRLTDPYLDPPGLFDAVYSEESVRLPETFWCYDPLTDQPSATALPATMNGMITFGCLNSFCKVNDQCLALWAQVLDAVPQSRLLLHAPPDPSRERVLAQLEQGGVAASRVEFVQNLPRQDYLKMYDRIDIALDPIPCNGGTTTLDAFWMGVPTLALVGKTVVGRAGWSLLSNLRLPELAALTPDQYVALAAGLAGDLPRLQELRTTLRQRMRSSPLMDAGRFARHVERAIRTMWRRRCTTW